jgi:hypothetical protein
MAKSNRSLPQRAHYDSPPDGPMEDKEIVSLLSHKRERALNRDDGDLSRARTKAMEYYRGGPIGDEDPTRSTYRTREIFEAVEWSLPSILSVFFSAKSPIVFEPVEATDVAQAEQETDTVDYYMFRRENSFLTFHDLFKSALLDPVAYAKVHVVKHEEMVRHKYEGLVPEQVVGLIEGDINWKDDPIVEQGVDGFFTFDGTELSERPEYHVEPVPPEQMLIDSYAESLDLDDVFDNYGMICHQTLVPFSELVKRGYDRGRLEEVGGNDERLRQSREKTSRFYREDEHQEDVTSDYAGHFFTVNEHYLKIDTDGDGISENRRIVTIGGEIFENEICEYMPFVATSVIPMPFKHAGISLAESMFEQQELGTKLMRMVLDDAYKMQVRRQYVDQRALSRNKGTIDQLRNPEEEVVVVNGDPRAAITWETPSPILDQLLALSQYHRDNVKARSGVAPDNALNPDVLRDSTAHGVLASMDKTSQRLMHMVRILAETAVKKIARKMHTLLRLHQDQPMILRLRGAFVPVNPADWRDRPNVRITVGLGFNSKTEKSEALVQILMLQKEAKATGAVEDAQIFHTIEEIIQSNDLGFAKEFFLDPRDAPWQAPPPPPDPQMEAVKLQMEVEKSKAENARAELESKERQTMAQLQVKEKEIEAMREKARAEAAKNAQDAKLENVLMPELRRAEIEEIVAKRDKLRAEVDEIRASIGKISAEASAIRAEPTTKEEPNNGEAAQ